MCSGVDFKDGLYGGLASLGDGVNGEYRVGI